ncbi:LysR family transcriptional regulator [Brevundimonas intermedia]|uniref:LysR family transcriptional regulator n=1 Tax=Brevundimonas intermedia TaxID=74315 RepID=UPI00320AC56A
MPEVDPLSGIAVFVAVARSGSFTRAAEQLGVTKSAVGKTIARLETRMGIKLFHRTTRLMKLTEDGEAYLAACATAMDDIVAAEAALRTKNQVLQGRLRVDMPVAFGRRVLLAILLEISQPHPGLSLTLTFNDATIDPLVEDVDLVIRFGALKDSSHLIARRLATQDRIICAAPAYLARHGVPETLADLPLHQGVVGSPKGPPLHWIVNDEGEIRRIAPPATHYLGDGDAMVDAAVGGLGLCQMPASMVRHHIASGALVPVLESLSTVPVDVHAVWPKQVHLSPRVRYAVDQLVAFAAEGRLS